MAKVLSGMVGIWLDEHKVVEAAHKTRQAGFKKFDAITPYPVHGMEEAMGLKRSWIPWATLLLGVSGFCLTFLFEAWTSSVSWPINVAGKPYVSWPAFIPVSFEGMVLIAGVLTSIILFVACHLPNLTKPVHDPRLTDDAFGVLVERMDPHFDEMELQKIFKECDAKEIKTIL